MKHGFLPFLLSLTVATPLAAQQRVGLTPDSIVMDAVARPSRATVAAPVFAAAGRDGRYLIATSESNGLFIAALDASGAIVAGSRRAIPALTNDPIAQFPAVAFDGERFLVAWIEGTAIPRLLAMRFDREGKPLEPVPQQVANAVRTSWIAVAADRGGFSIAYSGENASSRLARVGSDGTVIERDRLIANTVGTWRDIESNGTSALVATSFGNAGPCIIGPFCPPTSGRAVTRVPLGTSAASTPLGGANALGLSAALGNAVATDGQRFLVVSLIFNTAVSQWGTLLRGELTDTDGERVVREFLIAHNQPPGGYPPETPMDRIDAAWTGGAYAIAYAQRSGNQIDLLLTFASPTGQSLVDPVELASTSQDERTPVILPLGDGKVLVLFERGNSAAPRIVSRIASLSIRTRAVR